MSGFKFESLKKIVPESPELLFKSLKKSGGVTHPWAQQADTWREYFNNHLQTADVALELPTGSGKTLIGLVLAEWRRRKFNNKVLYLCPNNQLAAQVGAQASSYGIKASVMTAGNYTELANYLSADLIAIASYKGLFNTNPKFQNPDVIILDDAHSAEDSIGSLWSVRIKRTKDERLHRQILNLFRPELQDSAYYVLNDETRGEDRFRTYALAHPLIWKKKDALFSLLEAGSVNSDWAFEWSFVKDILHACQIFYSWNDILIRPLIAPTALHKPFSEASQRIYMSATLGAGGELERIIGTAKIDRVPLASSVENSGRRLFLFTNSKLSEAATEELLAKATNAYKRSLVLVPTTADAEQMKKSLQSHGVNIVETSNPAEALSKFSKATNASLIFANRYDGIDLPDEHCRLLVMAGKPVGSNLLERFLLSRLNATTVLRDRMRTRFVQGLGRCCRGDGDYAAVIIVGSALHEFCLDSKITSAMSSELQAEIAFGLSQSNDETITVDKFLNLINLLMTKSQDWDAAEEHILSESKDLEKKQDQESLLLMKTVAKEVRYQYELVKKNFSKASDLAIQVAGILKESKKLDGYRAWWLYLAAAALWLEQTESKKPELHAKVIELLEEASNCTSGVPWFAEIRQSLSAEAPTAVATEDILNKKQCEEALDQLRKLGLYDPKFETKMTELVTLIGDDNHTQFEKGLELLGKYLGFKSHRFSEQAAPDGIWAIGTMLVLVFEAKSEEGKDAGISLETVRQALGHDTWALSRLSMERSTTATVTTVITPRTTIGQDAANLLEDKNQGLVFYKNIEDLRELADTTQNALRQIRSLLCHNDEQGLQILREQFSKDGLLAGDLRNNFKSCVLESLKRPAIRLTK